MSRAAALELGNMRALESARAAANPLASGWAAQVGPVYCECEDEHDVREYDDVPEIDDVHGATAKFYSHLSDLKGAGYADKFVASLVRRARDNDAETEKIARLAPAKVLAAAPVSGGSLTGAYDGAALMQPRVIGAGASATENRKKRGAAVAKAMKEKGLSLGDASKWVSANGY